MRSSFLSYRVPSTCELPKLTVCTRDERKRSTTRQRLACTAKREAFGAFDDHSSRNDVIYHSFLSIRSSSRRSPSVEREWNRGSMLRCSNRTRRRHASSVPRETEEHGANWRSDAFEERSREEFRRFLASPRFLHFLRAPVLGPTSPTSNLGRERESVALLHVALFRRIPSLPWFSSFALPPVSLKARRTSSYATSSIFRRRFVDDRRLSRFESDVDEPHERFLIHLVGMGVAFEAALQVALSSALLGFLRQRGAVVCVSWNETDLFRSLGTPFRWEDLLLTRENDVGNTQVASRTGSKTICVAQDSNRW